MKTDQTRHNQPQQAATEVFRGHWRYAFFAYAALMIAGCFLLGPRHDYEAYMLQWDRILSGGDPWFRLNDEWELNAYGPTHLILALLYGMHPMLPRALFVSLWCVLSYRVLDNMAGSGAAMHRRQWLYMWLLLPLNPFFIVFTFAAGTHDIVVAASCVFAVSALQRGEDFRSGLWLSLGTLLKFIPVFLLPFMLLDADRRIRWRLLAGFVLAVGSAYSVCLAIWDPDSVLSPFLYAAERHSTLLSVFRFLRGAYSPLNLVSEAPDVDWLSLPMMAVGYGALLLFYIRRSVSMELAVSLCLLVIFLFYKVGHQQFYSPLFFLIPLWVLAEFKDPNERWRMLYRCTLPLVWVSVTAVIYAANKLGLDSFFYWQHDVLGLPTFVASVYSIGVMLHYAVKSSHRVRLFGRF